MINILENHLRRPIIQGGKLKLSANIGEKTLIKAQEHGVYMVFESDKYKLCAQTWPVAVRVHSLKTEVQYFSTID